MAKAKTKQAQTAVAPAPAKAAAYNPLASYDVKLKQLVKVFGGAVELYPIDHQTMLGGVLNDIVANYGEGAIDSAVEIHSPQQDAAKDAEGATEIAAAPESVPQEAPTDDEGVTAIDPPAQDSPNE